MKKPRILDLFCCAGGAAMGYHRAGFEVVGVDKNPQPNYPFEFHQGDALEFPVDGFDAIHASPPCQSHSAISRVSGAHRKHADLIEPTRAKLIASGLPWIMENVPRSPLRSYAVVCGHSVGLDVRRHRWFESSGFLMTPPCMCASAPRQFPAYNYGTGRRWLSAHVEVSGNARFAGDRQLRSKAMGIDWMKMSELSQAIPPAYTEMLGRQLLAWIQAPQRQAA